MAGCESAVILWESESRSEQENLKTKKKRKLCINGVKVSKSKSESEKKKTPSLESMMRMFLRNESRRRRKRRLGINKNRQVTSDSEDDFDDVQEGGLMYKYVRGSGRSEPAELKEFADLAIRSYNQTHLMKYNVVDIVTAVKFLVDGVYYIMTFTAKFPCQDDADALTFEANIFDGITSCDVESVRVVVDAPATLPVCCC